MANFDDLCKKMTIKILPTPQSRSDWSVPWLVFIHSIILRYFRKCHDIIESRKTVPYS